MFFKESETNTSRFDDDLDDFTYELMVGIVGLENMTFERGSNRNQPQETAQTIEADPSDVKRDL